VESPSNTNGRNSPGYLKISWTNHMTKSMLTEDWTTRPKKSFVIHSAHNSILITDVKHIKLK